MAGLASYEVWFYGGTATMVLAGILMVVQSTVFLVKRQNISRKLDEEYGQPQKYHVKDEGNQTWLQ